MAESEGLADAAEASLSEERHNTWRYLLPKLLTLATTLLSSEPGKSDHKHHLNSLGLVSYSKKIFIPFSYLK